MKSNMAHPQQRKVVVAQTDGVKEYDYGSPNSLQTSTSFQKDHDMEFDYSYSNKISVIARVKEKAKRWRSIIAKKKNPNLTPSWGVNLEDEEDDDENPRYLGAAIYESEMAPEASEESSRQHSSANPVISENHQHHHVESLDNATQQKSPKKEKITENTTMEKEVKSPKTISEVVTEKLSPAYNAISHATNAIASKIQSLTISNAEARSPSANSVVVDILSTSPKEPPRNEGVVEKAKDVVTSFIWTDESSHRASFNSAVNSSAEIRLPTSIKDGKHNGL